MTDGKTMTDAEMLRAAEAAFARGDLQESARLFAAVTRSSDTARAADGFYGLGMTALRQGRRPEAGKLFEAAVRANSRLTNAWYQLGYLAEPDFPQRAYEYYQRALAIDPSHVSAQQRIGALGPSASAGPNPGPRYATAPPPGAPSGDPREGVVSNLQQRFEQRALGRMMRQVYVWDFRVNREGLPPVAAEMRGFRFHGSISNGDRVRLSHSARPGKVLQLHRIVNLSSNSTVRVTRRPRLITTGLGILLQIVLLLIFLAIFATVAVTVLKHH